MSPPSVSSGSISSEYSAKSILTGEIPGGKRATWGRKTHTYDVTGNRGQTERRAAVLLRISSSSLPSWVPSNDHRRSMQRSSDGGMGGSFSPGQVNLESCINIETPRFKFLDEADETWKTVYLLHIQSFAATPDIFWCWKSFLKIDEDADCMTTANLSMKLSRVDMPYFLQK